VCVAYMQILFNEFFSFMNKKRRMNVFVGLVFEENCQLFEANYQSDL
jgi:hypothetical protein